MGGQSRALLKDTDPDSAHLLAYEQAIADPTTVLGGLMEDCGLRRPSDLAERVKRLSTMIRRKGTGVETDPTTAWIDQLSRSDRDDVLAGVRAAGITAYSADPPRTGRPSMSSTGPWFGERNTTKRG